MKRPKWTDTTPATSTTVAAVAKVLRMDAARPNLKKEYSAWSINLSRRLDEVASGKTWAEAFG